MATKEKTVSEHLISAGKYAIPSGLAAAAIATIFLYYVGIPPVLIAPVTVLIEIVVNLAAVVIVKSLEKL
jgi:hypothetical protein